MALALLMYQAAVTGHVFGFQGLDSGSGAVFVNKMSSPKLVILEKLRVWNPVILFFLTAIRLSLTEMRDDDDDDGPLAKNQLEPVTGPWVYTETVYLFVYVLFLTENT